MTIDNAGKEPEYKNIKLKIILAVVLQLVILTSFAAKRAYTINTGTIVILEASTVDPFDAFRGDYINLRYNFSQKSTSTADQYGAIYYTVLEKGYPYWKAVGTFRNKPNLTVSQVMLIGHCTGGYTFERSINYGIETFYVPEGQGKILQNQKHLRVEVAVDKSGTGMVKSVVPE